VDSTPPDVGVPAPPAGTTSAPHPLVAIGGAYSLNFQSAAMRDASLSHPAMIARTLGVDDRFHSPGYGETVADCPLDLETTVRVLEQRFGNRLTPLDIPSAYLVLRQLATQRRQKVTAARVAIIDDRSERTYHNLAAIEFDVADVLRTTADVIRARLSPKPFNPGGALGLLLPGDFWNVSVLQLLAPLRHDDVQLTIVDHARRLGGEARTDGQPGPGIGHLLIWLGMESLVTCVSALRVLWSTDDTCWDCAPYKRYSLKRPEHFAVLLQALVAEIRSISAGQVVWGTLPLPSGFPLLRGTGPEADDGYRAWYTRPWLSDVTFSPDRHPHLSGDDVRQMDTAVASYNAQIVDVVRAARRSGRDWRVADIAHRYQEIQRAGAAGPAALARVLPRELAQLSPVPDARLFLSDSAGRARGGLVSLDGVSPTTVGQSLIAATFLDAMTFEAAPASQQRGPSIDYERAIAEDTLLARPPARDQGLTPRHQTPAGVSGCSRTLGQPRRRQCSSCLDATSGSSAVRAHHC
jgi:hypothetical protein